MSKSPSDLPVLAFRSVAEWEAWLAAEPRSSSGLWFKLPKTASGAASIRRAAVIDAALCHGWIDGQLAKFDAHHSLIRFTPRRAKSKWSANNRARVLELIDQGRMQPAGLREVERAKADGRWDAAYASQSKATVPEDLQAALKRHPRAARLFDQLDSANRYAILYRIHDAKKPETRTLRIEKFVAMLGRGETIHPRKAKAERATLRPGAKRSTLMSRP